ncbi:MAG: hypothetical protein ACOY82_07920 [Pseudomonadota bacterium]
MRLLAFYDSESAAMRAARLLESRGIPTRVNRKFKDYPRGGAEPRISISCYLDAQYEDAQRLLRDRSHVVREPVDVREFHKGLEDFEETFDHSLLARYATKWLLATILFFALVVVASRLLR